MRSDSETLREASQNEKAAALYHLPGESYNSTPPAIVFNKQGEIVDVSDSLCQLIGSSADELRQMTIADLISQQIQREIWHLDQDSKVAPANSAISTITYDGEKKKGATASPILELCLYPHQNRDRFVLLLEELENKNSRNRLEEQDISRLYQQQRLSEVGLMTSGIAHEINNPITGIINYAQLISQRTSEAVLKEFAAEIIKEGERISRLVRNLLHFARNDGNEFLFISSVEIVEDSVNLMRPTLRKDDITVTIEAAPDLPLIHCIPQKISQVIVNLLSNARQALNSRYPHYHPAKRIIVNNELLSDSAGRWLRISVTDYGIGISPELGAKIFDPFFTTHRDNGGTGLGLTLCQMIVAEHHGRLTYTSQVNESTTFNLDLPLNSLS